MASRARIFASLWRTAAALRASGVQEQSLVGPAGRFKQIPDICFAGRRG